MGEWRTMTLHEAGVLLIDCVHKTPSAVDVGYPYVAIPQMKNGRIDFSDARRISHTDFIEWTKKARPQEHDVVLSRRTNPGVTATFGEHCDFALGQNLVLLRADGRSVRPEFLRWLVASPAWWSQIDKYNNVGAVFDSLRCADVPRFELPIPPKRDQEAIASVLAGLDDRIELNHRMNETLEAMARAIFKDWFIDFGPTKAKMEGRAPYLAPEIWRLFPGGLGDDGNPKGWRVSHLGEFFRLERGLSYKGEFLTEVGVPMINLGCFTGGGRFNAGKVKPYSGEFRTRHRVMPGDLVIANTDMTQKRVVLGSPYVISADDGDELIYSHHVYAARAVKHDAHQWTMFFYFHLLQPEFRERAEGFATGTTVLFLPSDAAEGCTFTIPSEQLNAAFLVTIDPYLQAIALNRRQNYTLSATRDLLLPKLLTGEIRVRDAEKVAVAVL